MNSFSFYYIEANIVCVIVFGIILLHNYFNIDRQEKQVRFDKVLTAFILYFLADCVWACIVDGLLPKNLINSRDGWRIIRRLTDHPALEGLPPAADEEILTQKDEEA